uniref:Protein V2 n=1 Tax=Ocimum yellow vein virus TaxID=2664942 RepID=A0A5Q0TS69_9GEMI|nr:precoat protein [Ocimum yellow vein virus]
MFSYLVTMWDPLENEFPETVHGFRCMLAVKYLLLVESTYEPDTLGRELIRDLIRCLRASSYNEASWRYSNFHTRFQGSSSSEFRQPVFRPCTCQHCPYFQKTNMGLSSYVQKAQDISDVQKPGCSKGL